MTTTDATTQSLHRALAGARGVRGMSARLGTLYLDRVGQHPENTSVSHPYAATALTFSLGAISHAADLPAWETAGAGVLGTVVAAVLAARHADDTKHGPGYRRLLVAHSVVSGLGASALATWADVVGAFDPVQMASLGLGGVLSGATYALLRYKERRSAKRIVARRAEEAIAGQQSAFKARLHSVFATCGLRRKRDGHWTGLTVRTWGLSDNKASIVLGLVDVGMGVTTQQVDAAATQLASSLSYAFRDTNWQVGPDSISVEQDPGSAYRFTMWIRARDVLAGSQLTWRTAPEAGTIADPKGLGLYDSGDSLDLSLLGGHALVVGGTGSGKSVLLNNIIGRAVEANDAVVWVAATDKLVPLVFPWLVPWLSGQVDRPAIDWVAGEQMREVHTMLAAAVRVARLRNKVRSTGEKTPPTPEYPGLVVILDEASSFLESQVRLAFIDHDGVRKERTCSELLKELLQISRSANVNVYTASQYGVQAALGDDGRMSRRNIPTRILMKVNAPEDAENVLVVKRRTQDATRLRNHTFYMQANADEPRVHKAKAFYLEGEEAIGRHVLHTHPRRAAPDEGVVTAADGTRPDAPYTHRWHPTANAEIVALAAARGFVWPAAADGSWTAPEVKREMASAYDVNRAMEQGRVEHARAMAKSQAYDQMIEGLPDPWRRLHDAAMEAGAKYGGDYFLPSARLAYIANMADSVDDDQGAKKVGQMLGAFGLKAEQPERGGPRGHKMLPLLTACRQKALNYEHYDADDVNAVDRVLSERFPAVAS